MPAFMQMGHDTENLIGEEGLDFAGIVLSPLNRFPADMERNVQNFRSKGTYEIILDSQLYFPRSKREKLAEYPYFPKDIDTIDLGAAVWWKDTSKKLANYSQALRIDAVTSPITYPRNIDDTFFATSVQVANEFLEVLPKGILGYQTVLADPSLLTDNIGLMRAASILSDTDCTVYYVVFLIDKHPREEFADSFELLGAMRLIRELKNTGRRVLIAFCSSDMLLYKCAGADSCATGKFFNLRRFTRSRFDDPASGGGQLPYWFEHGLMAFLRQADLLRIRSKGLTDSIEQGFSRNVWSAKILSQFADAPKSPWLAPSWRQYLAWFCQTEIELTKAKDAINLTSQWLATADENWKRMDQAKVFPEERKNNGEWIRAWLQALSDFALTK